MFKRSHARILKHHRHSSVYVEGRYMHVDTRISIRSKRGREIARETAEAILKEVGANEASFQFHNSPVQDPPKPPDSFTEEEGQAAVGQLSETAQRSRDLLRE